MKTIITRFALLLLCIPATTWAQSKKEKNAAIIKQSVEAQRYTFVAQTMLPSAGGNRQLTTDFDMQVSKDSIISYLPYFGRGYVAPSDPTKGPLQFTSTDFTYTVKNGKKGSWNIQIVTKDLQDRKQLSLSVFDNGNASVTVVSNNQQPISFNGYIKPKK